MSGLDTPLISVCVGSVRVNTLPFLVESIIDQQFRDWELIIAIQGDEKELINYVTQQVQKDTRISFIHLSRFGKTFALNQAVKKAHASIIAFTDDDCIVSKDWLATVYNCFTLDHSVGIVAGNLLPPPARHFRVSTCPATLTIECIYTPNEENGFAAPPGFYWGGGNFAVRKSVINLVGPFDEDLGPGSEFPSAEDVDFGLRAEALGVVTWTTPKSIVYHTYGRRYGIKNILKYHRLSAIGCGALKGKLYLWNHRLFKEWGKDKSVSEWVVCFIKKPLRTLLDLYRSKYIVTGYLTYLSKYEIDRNILTSPKTSKS